MPTGVCADSVAEGIEQSGQQRGIGGVGDDRGEHPVDVEGGEQRSPRAATSAATAAGSSKVGASLVTASSARRRRGAAPARSSRNRSAQLRTSLRATASRSAAIRRVRSVWFISMA